MQSRHALTPEDVPAPDRTRHPLIELMLARLDRGYRRGENSDDARIALAIEGGGMRGAVSAGMCIVLEQAGLIDTIDVIYGTSSGALNGSFTATGQAALGATNYIDTATRRFANPLRVLWGKTAIDFDLLFDELIRHRKPYDLDGLISGPPFRALGVDLATSQLCVLKDFADIEELILAVRVSCSLPLLSGPPILYRGREMADGGLIESMPYAAALAEGATHVLVLRSRPVNYRKSPYPRPVIELMRRTGHPALAPLMEERRRRYNAEAEHLQAAANGDSRLLQIAPVAESPKVGQLEHSEAAIRDGLAAGANAAAWTFELPPIDLFWQPNIYVAG